MRWPGREKCSRSLSRPPLAAALDPATPTRPPSLRLIQGIAVACLQRNATAAQQGLRVMAEALEPEEAQQALHLLVGALEPAQRYWLGTLDGPRVGRP